jgi:aconitate hydratase
VKRASESRDRKERHAIVAGTNYGQGSSRENAAIAPRYLGLEVVIAKSFARIHWQNLVNFGVLPLTFASPDDYDRLKQGTMIRIARVAEALKAGQDIKAEIAKGGTITLRHTLSKRQIDVLMEGGAINWHKRYSTSNGR